MFLSIIAVAVVGCLIYFNYDLFVHPVPTRTDINVPSTSGDWPMFQRDSTNSGYSPYVSSEMKGEIHWIYETHSQISAAPVIVDRKVFLSTRAPFDYKIIGLDADTGRVLWQRSVSSPIDRSMTVAGGLLFASIRNGSVIALNLSNGAVQWEFHADALTIATPTVSGGVVYITDWDENLYLIDAATGDLLSKRHIGVKATSSNPVVNDTVFAFRSTANRVHVLDARNGRSRFNYRIRPTYGSVALSGDRIYYSDTYGNLRAMDWTKKLYPMETKIRTLRYNLFAWGIGGVPNIKGFVWNHRLRGDRFEGTPTVADGMVYVTSKSGKVIKLKEFDGELVWTFDSGAEMSETVSVTEDHVIVGDANGILHVIDVDTGDSEFKVKLSGPINTGPVIAGDTIYVATQIGILYAIK